MSIISIEILQGQVLTQGPLNAASIVNTSCSFAFGGTNFTSPANATLSDNLYASATHCECCDMNTKCLTATNFGFSIPATATITGITVEIERRSSLNGHIFDNGLRLLKGGVEVGSNYASATQWPTMDTYMSYGGCSDLWGTTWTPADINASNFGLVFACIDYCPFNGVGDAQSFIDHVRITVCYTNSLPVVLHDFNIKENLGKNVISWKVEGNNHIREYQIEKIDNNHREFICFFNANDNPSSYQCEDKIENHGEKIYFLYAVDKNGEKQLIAQKSIVNTLQNKNITAYQNEKNLMVSIYMNKNVKANIDVIDILGNTVLRYPAHLVEGWNHIKLTTEGLNNGIYYIGSPYIGFTKITVVY